MFLCKGMVMTVVKEISMRESRTKCAVVRVSTEPLKQALCLVFCVPIRKRCHSTFLFRSMLGAYGHWAMRVHHRANVFPDTWPPFMNFNRFALLAGVVDIPPPLPDWTFPRKWVWNERSYQFQYFSVFLSLRKMSVELQELLRKAGNV